MESAGLEIGKKSRQDTSLHTPGHVQPPTVGITLHKGFISWMKGKKPTELIYGSVHIVSQLPPSARPRGRCTLLGHCTRGHQDGLVQVHKNPGTSGRACASAQQLEGCWDGLVQMHHNPRGLGLVQLPPLYAAGRPRGARVTQAT